MQQPTRPMFRLLQYLQAYRGKLQLAIGTSVLNKVADLMPPIMVMWILDNLNEQAPAWVHGLTGTTEILPNAIFLAILIVVVFAIESIFEWAFAYLFMTLAQEVQHDLRLDAYQKLQHREMAFFEENRTGNLMAMLNDDINQLERFLNSSFNEIVQLFTLFLFGGFVLFGVSWELAAIGLLPIPLILWGSMYYQKKVAPRYQRVRESVGTLSNRLENNISGILVIKSFTAEDYEADRVREVSKEYLEANREAIKLSTIYVPLIRMLIAIGFAAVMLVGSYWIYVGNGKLTLGELTMFAMMIQRMLWPVTRLGRVFDEYERANASARRVFGLMDTPNMMENPKETAQFEKVKGDIVFDKTSFNYSNGVPVLHQISFQVLEGQSIGIAGTTGAGKTTLIKLLLRLYDVTDGSVTIDGVDLRQINLQQLRRNIALVSQDVYLFHGTIGDNIVYGQPQANKADMIEASKQAQLHEFVESLPNGYDTIIGEKGIKLSGGQRQRLSIARAILKDAPILILDEATSAVDTETERAIQENIRELIKGRTSLIIAHRLSTIRHANYILVLKAGEIAERGSHEELLAAEGIYSELWNVQIGEISI